MDYKQLMASKTYIYLHSLLEPRPNSLRVLIERCKVSRQKEDIDIGTHVIKDTFPIVVDEEMPLLQIDFKTYISYTVNDESFAFSHVAETFEGNCFRIFTKSSYLDFIDNRTIASDIYPDDPYVHYEIVALDHIIDVISYDDPTITEIKRECF
ncbi:hypothetical protein HUG15_19680 [Salicibibacter cibarius]|uniref:Uncharacterized protein n=1 Tax=Salicibibacter cibarius TaxID=2743000 RepID=A0A7T7CD35_9BACI|nr:hypothetical protein [Salicibibacter cibarius]QQK77583.1 hypothetical protein HUG15_19680 [Salicibibacter cibarius]